MKSKQIKFEYDRDADAAYLKLSRARVSDSEEVERGVIADFDADGHLVGVEILRFARRFMRQAKHKKLAG